MIGRINGLYATATGIGGITIIESFRVPSNDRLGLELTGKQGDVMRESMEVAKTLAIKLAMKHNKKQLTDELTERTKSKTYGLHIHVPEGATPKDGPSAGIAMVTSIISSITGIPVNKTIAMTGEVTLRGHVLPIGGLKEKLLAAHRARIPTVVIPEDNKKDLVEIPKNVINNIEIIGVKNVEEVLKHALVKELKPIKWAEIDQVSNKNKEKSEVTSTH